MNNFFKFAPVAAAALLMTSCNSDDLLGGASNSAFDENLPSIEVTVNDMVTRANITGDGTFDWTDGDNLRVYDAALQKYDNFVFSTSKFILNNAKVNGQVPQYVQTYVGATAEENAYALFAGGNDLEGDDHQVSYNGWKQGGTAGVPVALVYIPEDLNYAESTLSTNAETATYKTTLPLWGRVDAPKTDAAKFSADLDYLTSFVRLRLENANKLNDPIVAVKVQSLKWKSATTNDDKTAAKAKAIGDMKKQDVSTFQFVGTGTGKNLGALMEANEDKPLNGWFDAELKDGGQLVNATDDAVNQANTGRSLLTIDVEGLLEANQNYLYIPVISGQKYDALAITYVTDGGTENIAAVYFDWEPEVGVGKRVGVDWPNTMYILDGTTPAKITKGIKENYDGNTDCELIFNQASETAPASQDLTVSTGAFSKNTIYLPQIKDNYDLSIYIRKSAGTVLDENLTIADAAGVESQGSGVVTLIFEGLKSSQTKNIIINSKANIVLSGDFTNTTGTIQQGEECANMTLGIKGGTANDFNIGATTFTATKGNLTVADVNATMNVSYDNANGTLAVNSKVGTVTVTNAKSATIAAPVTTVEALKNVTINVPYNATPANMTVGTLNIHKGVTAIKLDGGIINIVKNETGSDDTKTVNTDNVLVTSTGLSAIKAVNFTVGNISFTSSFAVSTKDGDPTYVDALTSGGDNPTLIYTGAQLAAVGTTSSVGDGGFKLATKITALTNWTSPALTKKFDGAKAATNGLTIAGVDAPLFGTVTADIENVALTCAFPETSKANGVGGLAKAAGAASITVKNVTVAGHIYGSYNVGGIFGTTGDNTVIIGANNADVVVSAAFHNTSSYDSPYNGRTPKAGTFGTIIGQAGTGAVTLTKDKVKDASATFDKAALYFNYNRLEDEDGNNIWQFKGNTKFIGYSPDATSLTYGDVEYTDDWVDANAGNNDKKVQYKVSGSSKKVIGTVRIIGNKDAVKSNVWYTAIDADFKSKMKTKFSLAEAVLGDDVDWSEFKVEVHNLWEEFAQ